MVSKKRMHLLSLWIWVEIEGFRKILVHKSIKILLFPSPTGYMLRSFRLWFENFVVFLCCLQHRTASRPCGKCWPLQKWLWSFCGCLGRFWSIIDPRSHCFQVQLVTCCDLLVYHLKFFGFSMLSAHKAASRPIGKCWLFCEMVMVMGSVSGEILEHNRSRSYYF